VLPHCTAFCFPTLLGHGTPTLRHELICSQGSESPLPVHPTKILQRSFVTKDIPNYYRWQDSCIEIRDAAQALLIRELNRLGGEGLCIFLGSILKKSTSAFRPPANDRELGQFLANPTGSIHFNFWRCTTFHNQQHGFSNTKPCVNATK
jgi:hypothetical protein